MHLATNFVPLIESEFHKALKCDLPEGKNRSAISTAHDDNEANDFRDTFQYDFLKLCRLIFSSSFRCINTKNINNKTD